jgi:hypothetical protein
MLRATQQSESTGTGNMRFSAFRENCEKQKDGAPVEIGVASFFIRRWGTKESDAALSRIRRELFGPFLSNDEQYFPELLANWLAEYGVVNWSGVYDEDADAEIAYTKRLARQIFLDPAYWLELNIKLYTQANNYENYLDKIAEEDAETIKK